MRQYAAEPAVFKHRVLMIGVNRSAEENNTLYDATRYAWKISRSKAMKAEVILATLQGMIIGVFVPSDWLEATAENFPGHIDAPGRFGFVGQDAPEEIKALYLHKRVPDDYRKKGGC